MNVEQQKQLANTILPRLNELRPSVLAGGAPRDWYFDNPAKDLDFFVTGKPSQEELQALFPDMGNLVPAAGDDRYAGETFTTYNLEGLEMPVQIISCEGTDTQDVIKRFPTSLSQAWYDGECHYSKDFLFTVKYEIFLHNHQGLGNHCYHKRVETKFPWIRTFCFSKEDALKTLGGINNCHGRTEGFFIIRDEPHLGAL